MHLDAAEALTRLGLDPSAFSIEEMAHNAGLTPGIWEVTSSEQRMVLKFLARDRPTPSSAWDAHWTTGSNDPQRWNYWAREALAYEHRLVETYESSGILAPRLQSMNRSDDVVVLLLEFVEGRSGELWDIADYVTASRSLGRAQGRLLSESSVPEHPWLSRGFLREYSSEKPVDWGLLEDKAAWDQPLVSRNFPPELRDEARWLHGARHRLYDIAESLPRTLCHLDFWTKNLIMRPDGQVGLLDWAFVGEGGLGEDIGNLIPDAAFDHFVPAASLPRLEASVLDAYLGGLADGGWEGDPRVVELGMCASAVKYDWLTPAMLATASASRQTRYGGDEIDADYKFHERGHALLDNARRARRAEVLAKELDL